MNTLMYSYIFIFIGISVSIISGSKEVTPHVLVSTPNVDSDPDDNITEVAELYSVEFKCDTEEIASLGEATNVNELKPSDVGVVAAIGDSLTAALFAKVKTVIGILPATLHIYRHRLEYRGVSWSIGGDEGATTLPNLIKHYNPNLQGYSVKTGKEGTANAAYNFAVSGAVASDLLEQATHLVDRIKSDNLNGKWKVVTLFIGGNDLCAVCENTRKFSPEVFYEYILAAIRKLSELDKVFVNLVQVVDVTELNKLTSIGCEIMHELYKIIDTCECIDKSVTHEYHKKYMNKIIKLEAFTRKEIERDDFTVVIQPFAGSTKMPKKDPFSYFAPDCFHFSQKGHLNAAVSLWNNMLEPVGKKEDKFIMNQPIKFPTKAHPYFYTHKNSESKILGVKREKIETEECQVEELPVSHLGL